MNKIFKIMILSFFIFNSYLFAIENAPDVRTKGSGPRQVAEAIAESGGSGSKTQSITKEFHKIKGNLKILFKNNPNDDRVKVCGIKENLLISTSTIAKSIYPVIVLIMVILFIMSVKILFLDNPESSQGGLTANVMKGATYFLFMVLLTQYNSFIKYWETKLIPNFASLCGDGQDNALSVVLLTEILYLIFVLIQFIGVIAIIMGITDLLKKDRTGTINIYGVGMKIIGGIILVNYKFILDWIGVIKLT